MLLESRVVFHQLGAVVAIAEKRERRGIAHILQGEIGLFRWIDWFGIVFALTVGRHVRTARRGREPHALCPEDLSKAVEIRILVLISLSSRTDDHVSYRVCWTNDLPITTPYPHVGDDAFSI